MFVVTSIMGFCLESLPGLRPQQLNQTRECDGVMREFVYLGEAHKGLYYLDLICTIFFTMELVIRFIFAPEKFKFIKSILNIIDLLALVPLYVQILFQDSDIQSCYQDERFVLEVMFILRIIRMFRIFHLVKHYQALKILVYALKASVQELMMLAIFLFIGMLIFASMIYYAERKSPAEPSDQFETIPKGFWWAIITMTTVGYGDIYPTSAIGCLIGGACAVSGVLLVALTIPVISNNFTLFYTHVRSRTSGECASDKSSRDGSHSSHERPGSFRFKRSKRMAFEETNSEKPTAVIETCMNGKATISRLAKKYSPVGKFSESSSMTDIMLKAEETEPILCRNRSIKAYSDDGVTYQPTDTIL